MANNFRAYQGGIQPVQGLYEMASQPGKTIAAGITNAANIVGNHMQNQAKMDFEQTQLDKKLAAEQELAAQKARTEGLTKYVEFSTKQIDREGKGIDSKMSVLFSTNEDLRGTLAELDPETDKARREEIKAQIAENSRLIQGLSDKKMQGVDRGQRIIDSAYRYGIGTPESGESKKTAPEETGSPEQRVTDFSVAQGNAKYSPISETGGVTFMGTPGVLDVNRMGADQGKGVPAAPAAGTTSFRQPSFEQNLQIPSVLRPVGTGITNLASKYPYGNITEDTAPVAGSMGRIVSDEQGRLSVAVNPLFDETFDEQNITSLAGIVGGINKTQSNERLSLGAMLSRTAKAAAIQQYNELKEMGAIPRNVTMTDFIAGRAVEAFEMGDEEAFEGLSPEKRAQLASVANATRGPSIAAPQDMPETTISEKNSEFAYEPITSNSSAATTALGAGVQGEQLPKAPQSLYEKFAAAGGDRPNPITGKVGGLGKVYRAIDAANQRAFSNQMQLIEARRADQRLAQNQSIADAARETKDIQKRELEGKESGRMRSYASWFPGLATTFGPPSIMGAVKDLESTSPGITERFQRDLFAGVPKGQEAQPLDFHRAWMNAAVRIPISDKQAEDELKNFTDATNTFRQGWDNISPLLAEFQAQSSLNALDVTMRRLLSPESATAANYRLFLLGAFRKSTVGGGNPSNFEQELLLNLVCDPKGLIQITDNSLARTRTLMLITTNNLIRDMQGNNFKPSTQMCKEITDRFRSANLIGPNDSVTPEMLTNFRNVMKEGNTDSASQLRALKKWAIDSKVMSREVIAGLSNLETKIARGEWIGHKSADFGTAKQNLTQYLGGDKVDSTEAKENLRVLDPVYRR